MSGSKTDDAETRALLQFSGVMSDEVILKKLEELQERRERDGGEIWRLKTILAKRKYCKMTLDEIGKKWDSDKSTRIHMASEIPEIEQDAKELESQTGGYAASNLYNEKWDDSGYVDLPGYFRQYCKK